MNKLRSCMSGAAAVFVLAAAFSFPAWAKEERTPVGHITLYFSSDIEPGESGGTVDVTLSEGECSIESVDIVNEPEYWIGGDKPKVEIWLSADSDYYFKKAGKSIFTFEGEEVKYVSCSTKNDKEEMVLRVNLEELDEDDEDLDVEGLYWDEENGIANWEHLDIAKNYRVRLCRDGSSSSVDDGIGTTYTVNTDSFDFSGKFPKEGSYYFKVRAIDSRGNAGDWQESYSIDVTSEDMAAWQGQWRQDERGWWFANGDGSYMKDGWQYIRSQWYFFDQEGYMKTGWIRWQDKFYYCGENGAMLRSTVTPDGAAVDSDGARIGDGGDVSDAYTAGAESIAAAGFSAGTAAVTGPASDIGTGAEEKEGPAFSEISTDTARMKGPAFSNIGTTAEEEGPAFSDAAEDVQS